MNWFHWIPVWCFMCKNRHPAGLFDESPFSFPTTNSDYWGLKLALVKHQNTVLQRSWAVYFVCHSFYQKLLSPTSNYTPAETWYRISIQTLNICESAPAPKVSSSLWEDFSLYSYTQRPELNQLAGLGI